MLCTMEERKLFTRAHKNMLDILKYDLNDVLASRLEFLLINEVRKPFAPDRNKYVLSLNSNE